MPTQDAVYQNIRYHGKKEGVPVVDDNGRVLSEVVRVMEICAEANIIFATGHSSSEESITLARKAREVGCEKVCRDSCQFRYLENDARSD